MDLKEFLSTTPESLAAQQEKALVEAVIARLDKIRASIVAGKYDAVALMLNNSPAGDCMGADNSYIDFSDLLPGKDDEDIGHVIDTLKHLRRLQEGEKKK